MSAKPPQLKVVTYPHPVLKQKAKPIEQITDEVRAVAQRMIELMVEEDGLGLAAPQVALAWRMFVANPTLAEGGTRVYINPVLSNPTQEVDVREEGCLSLPNVGAEIHRPLGITVEATDLDGNRFTESSVELAARVWQHETDHLDGKLLIDRMTSMDKIANRQAIKALELEYAGAEH